MFLVGSLNRLSLCSFFSLFKFIYQLTDDEESIRIATRNIINEFAKDNVKYLELRTTPRKNEETGKIEWQGGSGGYISKYNKNLIFCPSQHTKA